MGPLAQIIYCQTQAWKILMVTRLGLAVLSVTGRRIPIGEGRMRGVEVTASLNGTQGKLWAPGS